MTGWASTGISGACGGGAGGGHIAHIYKLLISLEKWKIELCAHTGARGLPARRLRIARHAGGTVVGGRPTAARAFPEATLSFAMRRWPGAARICWCARLDRGPRPGARS